MNSRSKNSSQYEKKLGKKEERAAYLKTIAAKLKQMPTFQYNVGKQPSESCLYSMINKKEKQLSVGAYEQRSSKDAHLLA